jgi:hypothetical protein
MRGAEEVAASHMVMELVRDSSKLSMLVFHMRLDERVSWLEVLEAVRQAI